MSKPQCSEERLQQLWVNQKAKTYEFWLISEKATNNIGTFEGVYKIWIGFTSIQMGEKWFWAQHYSQEKFPLIGVKWKRMNRAKKAYEDAGGVWFDGPPRFAPKHLQI